MKKFVYIHPEFVAFVQAMTVEQLYDMTTRLDVMSTVRYDGGTTKHCVYPNEEQSFRDFAVDVRYLGPIFSDTWDILGNQG